MKISTIILFVLVALIGCSSDNGVQVSEDMNKLSFTPDALTISQGDSTIVSLQISGLTDAVFGLSFQISCDSAIVNFVGEPTVGDFFGQDAIAFSQTTESIVHMSITKTQGNEPVRGSGILCTLLLSGKSEGDCLIQLLRDELHLFDLAGDEIANLDLEIESARVHVR